MLLLLLLFLDAKLVIVDGDADGEFVFDLLIGVVVCGNCVLAGVLSEQVVVTWLVVDVVVVAVGDCGIVSDVEWACSGEGCCCVDDVILIAFSWAKAS